jgi:hypothetical protein
MADRKGSQIIDDWPQESRDPDDGVLTDRDLEEAVEEGEAEGGRG